MTTKPTDAAAEQDKASGTWIGKVDGDLCKQEVEVAPSVVAAATDAASSVVTGVTGGNSATSAAPTTKTVTLGSVASSTEEKKAQADKAAADKAKADQAAADTKAADDAARLKQQQNQQGGGGQVGPAPAAALATAPAALAAAGPVGALPPLAGIAPAGLASNLFSANTYDPGLLFGSPLGNAASALYSPKADSDVTTVSQAQALITAGGGGYGTPVTIGVIILACLIGIAVRHRVISRMKNRELPAAEYRPRHAAPESEVIEHEQPAADDARTLVVLTPR